MTMKLKTEKKQYFRDQLPETKEDPCGTWKNLKQLLGGSKSTGAANEVKDNCNIFNRYLL